MTSRSLAADRTDDLGTVADVARTANALTLFGAVPFVGLAALALFGDAAARAFGLPALALQLGWWATLSLALYAAAILSFLGGIRFGLAVGSAADGGHGPRRARRDLAISVLPSLAAWVLSIVACLGLFSGFTFVTGIALALAAACVLAQWAWDRRAARHGLAPAWFGPMRSRITAIVVPVLLVGAYAATRIGAPG